MSLDWNIRAVENYQDLTADENQQAVTQAVVFGCIATGIGTLTEENWAEYAVRATLLQTSPIGHPWLIGSEGPVPVTAEDVKRRIGLTTNVFPEESRAKWVKRIVSAEMDRAVATLKRDL